MSPQSNNNYNSTKIMLCRNFVAVISACLMMFLYIRMAKTIEIEETDDSVRCNLVHKLSSNDTNILAVGKINLKIFLITKDFYVFELPSNAIKGKLNSSVLYIESNPEPMSKKWPALWNNNKFTGIKNYIYGSFTLTDFSNRNTIFFVSTKQECGLCYDIDRGKVFQGSVYNYGNKDFAMISSIENKAMYQIERDEKSLRIAKYMLQDSMYLFHEAPRLCAIYDRQNGGKDSRVPEKIMVAFNCEHQFVWPVYSGFEDDEQFYLFGPKSLLIFSSLAVTEPNKAHVLVEKKYEAFFACTQDYSDRTTSYDRATSSDRTASYDRTTSYDRATSYSRTNSESPRISDGDPINESRSMFGSRNIIIFILLCMLSAMAICLLVSYHRKRFRKKSPKLLKANSIKRSVVNRKQKSLNRKKKRKLHNGKRSSRSKSLSNMASTTVTNETSIRSECK